MTATTSAASAVRPEGPMEHQVMFVDDEPAITANIRRALHREPYRILTANSAREALGIMERESVAVVVSDQQMPEMPGSEFLTVVRQRHPDTIRIILTGQASLETAIHAVNDAEIYRFLTKPCTPDDLAACLRQALAVLTERRGPRGAANDDALAIEHQRFDRAVAGLWMSVQPVVSLSQRRIFAYEALVRTTEPSVPHGGAFIELAESLGGMRDLERRIRHAVADFAATVPDDALLLVNLHPGSLDDPELFAADAPLAPFASRIAFELTERASLHSLDAVTEKVAALRARGYRIAVDDLGAGYAGLTSIALLHPDIVKLDMALVRDLDATPTKANIVGSMAGLCRDLGITVIAEGVETPAERDKLASLGCDLLQGYYFSRPARPFPAVHWG